MVRALVEKRRFACKVTVGALLTWKGSAGSGEVDLTYATRKKRVASRARILHEERMGVMQNEKGVSLANKNRFPSARFS